MSVYTIIANFNPSLAIIKILKDHPDGMNIKMIANGINLHYETALPYIERLKANKDITEERIGKSRVFHYAKTRP